MLKNNKENKEDKTKIKKINNNTKRVQPSFYKEEKYIPDDRKTNDEIYDMARNIFS